MARDPNASYEGKNQRTPISIKQMQEQIKELQAQQEAAQDTITQLNSDLNTAKSNISTINSSLNMGTMVGQSRNSDNVSAKPWFKVAEVEISDSYTDADLVMYVKSSHRTFPFDGILRVHIRTNANSYFESGKCYWILRKGITLSDFVLAYNTNTKPTKAELWCKNAVSYRGIQFDVISCGSRTNRKNQWTFTNTGLTDGGYASITSGYTQLVSTDAA